MKFVDIDLEFAKGICETMNHHAFIFSMFSLAYNLLMFETGLPRFIDEIIQVEFDTPLLREKSPDCPNRFIWHGETYHIQELLAQWSDFERRGRAARNMRPSHAAMAVGRGSLGVGRFFFRVVTQSGQFFELYYDRAPKDALHRKGEWYLYREMCANQND